ncbi:hypothetical protein IDJ77_25305 [Mucilaginibacter sp. ZT4R22]|uniref:Lipoprotein n=1 Tax=Mucilaginibacter pankratovii TaxID=2772110 RepID=A0ABR7WXY8_9SPHI|nr:hypothetical protein [Mucilaginibacter pankratovii]MBD1367154.1 hypothetical protein [Mucilaginibacter pankratovii]
MKKRFTYLLPALTILIALATSCSPNKPADPVPVPTGTFNGQFRKLHRAKGATKIDTTKATIQLVLESGGTYKVLGDTATLHAGSKGGYSVVGNALAFQDATYSASDPKIHLYGYYAYYYDNSSVLQMVLNSSDTLSLQYDLKKVN